MTEGDFYDAVYFGHVPVVQHKSNYSRVGGYREDISGAYQWAAFVWEKLREYYPDRGGYKVLEVGAACGYAVRHLRALGVEAYGVDFSQYILSRAEPDVKPYLGYGDARRLEESEFALLHAPYDLVISKDVLEHLTEDELKLALKGMAKLAPYQLHQVNTGEFDYQAAYGDISHVTLHPLEWWRERAKKLRVKAEFVRT